jgi:PilZ domain
MSTVRTYHRRSRRIAVSLPVRLRPSSPRGELLDEITNTTNVSSEGFYFLTERDHYQEGMRLFVTLPYHWPRAPRDRGYLAQVIRIELLDDGKRGVAVQLLSSVESWQ